MYAIRSYYDPAGKTTTYTYNDRDLLTGVTDPDGGKLGYEYDSEQYLIKLKSDTSAS